MPDAKRTHSGPQETDELTAAVNRQRERAEASRTTNRSGWSDADWIADADRLMNEEDGAVTSLLNGHALALLRTVERLNGLLDEIDAVMLDDNFGKTYEPMTLIAGILAKRASRE